jgi:hypothetical protein
MISIPKQLEKQKFIFTDNNKSPFEKEWTTKNNYDITNEKFINYLKQNNIYGVLCGVNNLVVIDFDNEEIQYEIINLNIFPETFTVKSGGKGLYHLYFYVVDEAKSLIANMKVEENDERHVRHSDEFKLERTKEQAITLSNLSLFANSAQRESISKLLQNNREYQEFLEKNIELIKQCLKQV